MRLYQTMSGAATLRLAYDGLDRIAEYDGSNNLLRRYVHGPNDDEPLVWYEGSGTSDRRFLSSDDLGSIISVTDSSGTVLGLNKYDEYGKPQAGNLGVFGYTGQAWLPSVGLWYYKARAYDPELGRFLQTDPIGVEGGINLYAYVGNDPINATDPLGLNSDVGLSQPIVVRGYPDPPAFELGLFGGNILADMFGNLLGGVIDCNNRGQCSFNRDVVVRGKRAPRRERQLNRCQITFFSQQLGALGLPTGHLPSVRFVSGLDRNASAITRAAFGNANAVTQGNTIYVQPKLFDQTANFQHVRGFEEIVHTAQFASEGAGMYRPYAITSIGGVLSALGLRGGNVYEQFAIGTANQLSQSYQQISCN